MRETGDDERLRHPDLVPVRPDPGHRHVWNHAHDRIGDPVERDAASERLRITPEPAFPEMLGDDGDICAFLFVRQKGSPANWLHPEHVKIIRRDSEGPDLHRFAQPGEGGADAVVRRETVEEFLAFAIKLEARRGKWPLQLRGGFFPGMKLHQPTDILEGQAAQEKVVNQAEDRGVEPDPEGESEHRQDGEAGRFDELSQRKTQVGDHTNGKVEMRPWAPLDSTNKRRD